METKQTAVEWAEDELAKLNSAVINGELTTQQYHKQRVKLWERAKAMEKKQILKFANKTLEYTECSFSGMPFLEYDLEKIYNETYDKTN